MFIVPIKNGETATEYLLRLGNLKESHEIDATWPDLTVVLNSTLRKNEKPEAESTWRKKFKKLKREIDSMVQDEEEQEESTVSDEGEEPVADYLLDLNLEREKILLRDQRTSLNKAIRQSARSENIFDLFREIIQRYNSGCIDSSIGMGIESVQNQDKAIYVMLSDIHYGITYDCISGKYNSKIAKERIFNYANNIINYGLSNDIKTVYVSLMGDMISGIIHSSIRAENRENVVEQIVGVSEAVSEFLLMLCKNFDIVYCNSVPGNHSRIDLIADNASRNEKLDNLISWYCKTKLENINNFKFVENDFDSTIGSFKIFGNKYYCVHGDMDQDLRMTANRISRFTNDHVDYLMAGHMHVVDVRIDDTTYVRNGSVCGSGDDYTMKKRLFAPAVQMFVVCTPNGIEEYHPVRLE